MGARAEVELARVDDLLLDPGNPRLPEDVQGGSQATLLRYLDEYDSLSDLASSMVQNGFFPHEPLVVLPKNEDGRRVVVEGNRRLATLKILIQDADAQEQDLEFDLSEDLPAFSPNTLNAIPVYEIDDPDQVWAYLGYRHISGIRKWDAESKARFVARSVDRFVEQGEKRPFLAVANLIGSNTQTVRSAYVALTLLRHARDEYGFDIRHIMRERFGVWQRLLGTAGIPQALRLRSGRSHPDDIRADISETPKHELLGVLEDLTPAQVGSSPVLKDSRDVTRYSDVLRDDRARAILREHHDLDLAFQLVEGVSFRRKVERLASTLESLAREARELEDIDQEIIGLCEDVQSNADMLVERVRRGLRRAGTNQEAQ